MTEQDSRMPWRDFEREVASIFRALGADVEHDVAVAGNQIDVVAREKTSSGRSVTTIIECKSYHRPVGVEAVNALSGLFHLLKGRGEADAAVLVAQSGFTRAARHAAQSHGVELLELADLRQRASGRSDAVKAAAREVRADDDRKSEEARQSLADVPFDIANYRVLIYEQSITGSEKLAGDLERAIQELLAALDRTNNPSQEVLSQRATLGSRQKIPLAKCINLSDLPARLRDWLNDQGIAYADDIRRIDVRKMAGTPGLGKVALGKFFAALLEHDLDPDGKALQDVIVEYGIRTRPDSLGRWS